MKPAERKKIYREIFKLISPAIKKYGKAEVRRVLNHYVMQERKVAQAELCIKEAEAELKQLLK